MNTGRCGASQPAHMAGVARSLVAFERAWAAGVTRTIFGVLMVVLGTAAARGQCPAEWLPGDGLPGVGYGAVYATGAWDPDGAGPLPTRAVVGGSFTMAGRTAVQNIGIWEGTRWSGLGGGVNAQVYALATLPSGELLAAGNFTSAGGRPANRLASWDGATWTDLGAGLDGNVRTMLVLPNGDLLVGGGFVRAGGVVVNHIARRDAITGAWSALGEGVNGVVRCMAMLPDGRLVAGGSFTLAGEVVVNRIAVWDGGAWSSLSSGMVGPYEPYVDSVAVLPGGAIMAGGNFVRAGGVQTYNVAKWDGATWSPVGPGLFSEEQYTTSVTDLLVLDNGDVLACGYFYVSGGNSGVGRWNGSAWTAVGEGLSFQAFDISRLDEENLIIGGEFSTAGAADAHNVARWNEEEARWYSLGAPGFDRPIYKLAALPDGGLVAGGQFVTAGAVNAQFVARWDGADWSPMGTGMNDVVTEVVALPDGSIVAAGPFTMAGGVTANHIARWDGFSWSAVGPGVGAAPSAIGTLLVMPGGDLLAGGRFTPPGGAPGTYVARWNGIEWSLIGAPITLDFGRTASVSALAIMPNGDLIAGGEFTRVGSVTANRIARWNGVAWSALGTGMGVNNPGVSVTALAVMPNGDLIAGGWFSSAGGVSVRSIARWNGLTWARLTNGVSDNGNAGTVSQMLVLENGELLVVGRFDNAGNVTADNIARWNGASWAALDRGVHGNDYGAYSVVRLPNGDLAVGGSFDMAGDHISRHFAQFTFGGELLVFDEQPDAAVACPFAPVSFTVSARGGIGAVSYQWRRNQVALVDAADHIAGATTPTLTIMGASAADVGHYDCVASDACTNVISAAAPLTYCAVDFTCDGTRDSRDFFEFLSLFFADDARADFNNDDRVDSDDFFAFLTAFFAGCE